MHGPIKGPLHKESESESVAEKERCKIKLSQTLFSHQQNFANFLLMFRFSAEQEKSFFCTTLRISLSRLRRFVAFFHSHSLSLLSHKSSLSLSLAYLIQE